jgi:hypothetical protein
MADAPLHLGINYYRFEIQQGFVYGMYELLPIPLIESLCQFVQAHCLFQSEVAAG